MQDRKDKGVAKLEVRNELKPRNIQQRTKEPLHEKIQQRVHEVTEPCKAEGKVLKKELKVLAKKCFATAFKSECTSDSSEKDSQNPNLDKNLTNAEIPACFP